MRPMSMSEPVTCLKVVACGFRSSSLAALRFVAACYQTSVADAAHVSTFVFWAGVAAIAGDAPGLSRMSRAGAHLGMRYTVSA